MTILSWGFQLRQRVTIPSSNDEISYTTVHFNAVPKIIASLFFIKASIFQKLK